jgi:hypothetical protein
MFQYAGEKRAVLQSGLLYMLIASGQLTLPYHMWRRINSGMRRSDQGECLNDDKPGLPDGAPAGQFGGLGERVTN